MEGYQNYQAIIDAIKAEYVNARNLKKTATAKKRVATNAKSFKTRKENEKTSLETKLTSVENSLESNLETSFNNLEDARFDALKSELSELKGKLAFIDADIIRLEDRNSEDPGNIGTFPSAEPTSIESQSLTVLRNMLSVTIADAELVITNLYDGQDYAAIKDANVPTQLSNTEQEVISYYQNLQTTFDQLFDKTKDELDDFVISIFTTGDTVNNYKNELIDHSGVLVTLKSQLADLLNDEGTEVEINAKEQQIEDLKEIMLTKATDLKQIEVGIGSAMTTQKLVKLKRYATDLNFLTEELSGYRWDNHGFLKNQFPRPDFDIAYRSFVLYSGFFEFMDNNQFLNTSRGFNNGQWTEFKLLKEKITQAKEYYRTSSQFRDRSYDDTNMLYQTQQLFDCDQRNNGNGTEYYNITDFRPDVSQDTKRFYVNYSRQLHNATSNYTSEMHKYKFYKQAIHQHIQDFEEIVYQQNVNISALRSTKMQHLWTEAERTRLSYGHYEGTNEQHVAFNNTRGGWIEAEAEYLSQFYTNRSKVKTFELYNSIFPEFYSDLSTLESTKNNLDYNFSSLNTTFGDLLTSLDAAYAYLQTLTVGEADYVAALADYEAKLTNFNDAVSTLSSVYGGPRDNAYNLWQTSISSYESAPSSVFPFGRGFNFDGSYIRSSAIQSDGKIIAGGYFYLYNGTSITNIIRLNTDGSRDTSFNVGSGFNSVPYSIAIQSDGKILIGGVFESYNGTSANRIIRLNSDGSKDTSFNIGTGFNSSVSSIAIQSDGKILIGGAFESYNGTSANYIIRLNSDGSKDTSFNIGTGFNGDVKQIKVDPNNENHILVVGNFTSYNGTSANRIIRLQGNGEVLNSFGTGFSVIDEVNPSIHDIIILSDGKLVVSGWFRTYAGYPAGSIVMLSSNGEIYSIGDIGTIETSKYLMLGAKADYDTKQSEYVTFYNSIYVDSITHLEGWPLVWQFMSTKVPSLFPEVVTLTIGDGDMFRAQINTVSTLIQEGYDSANTFGWDESTFLTKKAALESSMVNYNLTYRPANQISAADGLHGWIPGDGGADITFTDSIASIRDEAYTFLQTLTDEDAAYQAALTDWNSKLDATDLFNNGTLVPAQIAFQSAVDELNQYLSTTWGSELNLSYTGTALKGFKDERDSSNTLLEQALAAKSTTEAAFMEAINSMTLVQSTPLEKRQGMRMQIDERKRYKQVERLESLANRYSYIFPIMVNQAGSFANEVRSRDEAYFTGLLQSVKDFMDGVHINNLGSNLYIDRLNYIEWSGMHAGTYQLRLNTIFKPLLRDWNMSFGSNNNQDEHINIADAQYNAIQLLSTDIGIDRFMQTISNINNELFRNVEGFGFGSRIIDEVNNGTPLI